MSSSVLFSPARAVVTATLLALVLTGCALKRDSYETPEVALPETYREIDKATDAIARAEAETPMDETLPDDLTRWWTRFNSAELNDLVERALRHNWNVRAAVARLEQAEAGWRRTRAAELPTLDGFFDAGVSAPEGGIGSVPEGGTVSQQGEYSMGLRASYEVDLWGANRAASVAAYEESRASAFARRTVAWTLTADVVTAYLQVLSLQDRVATAKETKRILTSHLEAVRERMEGGDADRLQVAQQRAAVAEAAAVIPALELQRDEALHAIALLVGTSPKQLDIKGGSLSELTFPAIQPGIPSRLLLRRPDILQAEAALLGADANIDAARAAFLPSFNLTGEAGFGSNVLASLVRPESLVWSLTASVLVAIFDGGANQARLDAARARHKELVATFMQTAYTAMREVEDALSSVHYLDQRLEGQREAVAAAREAYELSLEAFDIGVVDFINLLDTERTLFDNKDTLHQVEFDRATASVALFQALGGDVESQATSGTPRTRPDSHEPPEKAEDGQPDDDTPPMNTVPLWPLPTATQPSMRAAQ